jgi:hypothetical protein
MKYKILLINCLFFAGYTLNINALPLPLQVNTIDLNSTLKSKKLNIHLPLIQQGHQREATTKIKPIVTNDSEEILTNTRKFYKIKLLTLRKTKNAVLKAVLKRRSYGLRYTRRW